MHKGNTAPNPVSKSAKAFTEKTKKEPTTSDADDHANRQRDALGLRVFCAVCRSLGSQLALLARCELSRRSRAAGLWPN